MPPHERMHERGGERPSPPHRSNAGAFIVVMGEVLWDVFPESVCLGGAPLNFAAHVQRLGHSPLLISALGADDLGHRAAESICALGLDGSMLRRSALWKTGTASVAIGPDGHPAFRIERPAAYDDVQFTQSDLEELASHKPSWLYYGTLFPSRPESKASLDRLLEALPQAKRFYDVNLRPGFDSLDLVATLIAEADVVKLNESEADAVGSFLGLPSELEAFCRRGAERFGWTAVCVTLGEQGCAMLRGSDFVRVQGCPVQVADTVGAGDAFAAAFLHGLLEQWPVADIARFCNQLGALVASRTGAIPEWDIAETASL